MGYGGYSINNSVVTDKDGNAVVDKDGTVLRATNCFVKTAATLDLDASNFDIFKQQQLASSMNPYGVQVRESRDSADHPNSLAVIMALDMTGSMGSVPNFLIKEGFNAIMEKAIQGGEADPQVLFVGVGDHEVDRAAFQVGQFESNDELLHKWFMDVFIEGGGGGNAGESYLLAWYFAAYKTSIDCFEKRGRKGLLFTIGDEPTLEYIGKEDLDRIFGGGQHQNFTAKQLLEKAREKYEVYHIHVRETSTGKRRGTEEKLKALLGDSLLVVEHSKDVASVIAETILKHKQEGVASENVQTTEVLL